MARSLFSPRTPGGPTSFSSEWSPNLGIIKCHSPVPAFGKKGCCATPKSTHRVDFRVNPTQEFEVTSVKKVIPNRVLSIHDENMASVSYAFNNNPDIHARNSVDIKSTSSQVRKNLSSNVFEDKENSNLSTYNIITEKNLCQNDDRGCMATYNSEIGSQSPFDIICSPVKKKAKVQSEVARFESKCSSDERGSNDRECNSNDKADIGSVSIRTSIPISRNDDIQEDGGKCDNKVLASQKCHTLLFKDDTDDHKTVTFDGYSHERSKRPFVPISNIDRVNHQVSNCNSKVLASQSLIKKNTGNCKNVALDGQSHEKTQKTFDSVSPAIPEPIKPNSSSSSSSRFSLLGMKKSVKFRYPSKSDESYEKLGLTFMKTLPNEKPTFYQNDADCFVKRVKANSMQSKANHVQKNLQSDVQKESFDCPKSSDLTENSCISTLKTIDNETSHAMDEAVNLSEKITRKCHSFPVLATTSGARVDLQERSVNEVQSLWQESETDDYIAAVQCPSPQKFSETKLRERSMPSRSLSAASGADIRVSDKQMKKDQTLCYEDIDNNPNQDTRNDDSTNEKNTSDNADDIIHAVKSKVFFDGFHAVKTNEFFDGFITGGGAKRKASEKQRKKTLAKFEEVDHGKGEDCCAMLSSELLQDLSMTSSSKIKFTEDQGKMTELVVYEENSLGDDSFKIPEDIHGISTTSSSNIKPSKEQSKKSLAVFKRSLADGCELNQVFSTTSKLEFKPGEEQIRIAQTIFMENLNQDGMNSHTSKSSTPFQGFTTAKGTKISFDEEKLKKVQNLFENLDDDDMNSYTNRSSTPHQDFVRAQKKDLNQDGVDTHARKSSTPFQGFITAKGTKINFDEEKLKKVQNLFENLDDDDMNSYTNRSSTPHQDFVRAPKRDLNQDGVDTHARKSSTPFQGFTTAKGTKINFDEEKLKKVQNLFENLDDDDMDSYTNRSSTPHQDFVRAPKRDLNQDDVDTHARKSSTPFQGFTTAKGTKINFDEEKLKKVQNLFENLDDGDMNSYTNRSSTPLQGLLRAPGSKIKTSENQIKKSQTVSKKDLGQGKDLNSTNKDVANDISHTDGAVSESKHSTQFLKPFGLKIKLGEEQVNKSKDLITLSIHAENNKVSIEEKRMNLVKHHSSLKVPKKCSQFSSDLGDQSNGFSHNMSSCVNVKAPCKGNVDSKFSHIRTSPQSLLSDEFRRDEEEDEEVKSLIRHHVRTSNDDDDDERSVSPIIGSQSVSLKQKTVHARKNMGPSKKPLSNFSCENDLEQSKASGQETLSHFEGLSAEGNPNDSYAQEINVITEVFLRDESWNPEESSGKKRKAYETLEENNVIGQSKHLRHSNYNLSSEEAEHKECIANREMERRKQEKIIVHKKRYSVHPIQGCLHKKRHENKHQRLNLRSLGKPKTFKDCSSKIYEVIADTALSFRFSVVGNLVSVDCGEGCLVIPGPDGCIGVTEIEQGFLAMPGVSPKLLPLGWVSNHYTWIVWKFGAMQRRLIPDNLLTVENVVAQLKYRYDREIDRAERSIIRKIIEGDDIPQKTMVLCIASIHCKEDEIQKVSPQKNSPVSLMTLTDGWYSIKALVDSTFVDLYRKGKVNVGMKLVIHGAELIGHDSPCHPLDAPSGLRLRLHSNMTRRARWWCRMGLISQKGPMPSQLSAVHAEGGLVGRLSVVISRVYPLSYFEKSDGKSIFRGEKAHLRLVKANQHNKETAYLQIVTDVEKEFEEESLLKKVFCISSLTKEEISNLKTGEDIAELIENTIDPTTLEGLLTTSQISLAHAWRQEKASKREREVSTEVKRRLAEKQKNYEATPLLKLRIVDSGGCSAMLSVWRPPEELQQELIEGKKFDIQYVLASGYRRGCLQLTASRKTHWECIYKNSVAFPDVSRQVTPLLCTMSKNFSPTWDEVDVIGVVFRISEMSKGLQIVYIVDHCLDILCLKFWGGLKEFGVEEIANRESIICVSNGSWQGYNGGKFGSIYVTELTCVSSSPHSQHLGKAYETLKNNINDMKALMHKADLKVDGRDDDFALSPSDDQIISHVQSYELAKVEKSNKTDSVASRKVDDDASFTDKVLTPVAKRIRERSRDMRSRMQKLSRYGVPSPIGSATFCKSSPSIHRPFKCPIKK